MSAGATAAPTAPTAPVTVHRWDLSAKVSVSALTAVVVGLAVVPFLFTQSTTGTLTELFILVILASMWNAMAGFAGLVSVGQQAFIGIGAYATIVLADHGVNAYVAVVLAAGAALLLAVPTSYLALRLRGGQFAIAMWVIAETFRLVLVQFQSLGGGTGKSLTTLNVYSPADRQAYTYWVALAVTVALLVGLALMLRSRLGIALQAIRDDEVGASSLGVRTMLGKRLIFAFSALGCGAAGALIAVNSLRIQPDSIFGVQYTAYMIFMVLIGGLGSFEGAIVGALIFFGIQQQFADQGTYYLIGLGLLAIAFTLVAPRGIWGAVQRRTGLQMLPLGYRLRGLPTGDARRRAPAAGDAAVGVDARDGAPAARATR